MTDPFPLELDARGFAPSLRGLVGWWRWVWWVLRYVVDTCFVALIILFVSGRRSTLRQRASESSLPLDRRVSTRRRPLCLVLHATVRFLCHAVGRRVRIFVRGASDSFGSGLATSVKLHTTGLHL